MLIIALLVATVFCFWLGLYSSITASLMPKRHIMICYYDKMMCDYAITKIRHTALGVVAFLGGTIIAATWGPQRFTDAGGDALLLFVWLFGIMNCVAFIVQLIVLIIRGGQYWKMKKPMQSVVGKNN